MSSAMTQKPRIQRDDALAVAHELMSILRGDCERIVIAGSLRRGKGGTILPFGMHVQDGWLWRGNARVETPEERDVFEGVGMPWLEPEARS